MKKLVQLMLVLCISLPFYAFQSANDNEWKVVTQQDGVILSKQVVDCTNPDAPFTFLILKLENTTDKLVQVEFSFDMIKNGQLVSSNINDVSPSVTLRPGESIQGECSWTDQSKLSHFKAESANAVKFDDIVLSSFTVITQ